ncbi:hypothetical protein HS7_10160 [Sulfolobales archaeon HS-7]|nr:hypothetical protein HS7_10160 [Sulfolobales archaeon HS-7]
MISTTPLWEAEFLSSLNHLVKKYYDKNYRLVSTIKYDGKDVLIHESILKGFEFTVFVTFT